MAEKYLYEVKFSGFDGMTYMVVTDGPNHEAAVKKAREACEAEAEGAPVGHVDRVECVGTVLMA